MSSGENSKISSQDIQGVQTLIEQYLKLYMTQKEVINTMFVRNHIEPSVTELVWQKLEEENQEFFKAYHLRLMVKEQIMEFNSLLARQVELMHQVGPAGVAFIPMSNGSHIPQMHQNSACYAPLNSRPLKMENMQQPLVSSLSNAFTNCGSSMHSCMQPDVDMSPHSRRIDVAPNMLDQNLDVAMIPGMNGRTIKSEAGYTGSSRFVFGADGNVLESCPGIGAASVSSFSSVESTSQALNETLLDADPSFGFFGQISQNFSLSDLTADFSNSTEILDNYSRPPFLATETNNFTDSHSRGEHQGDNRRLDTISEGLSFEDFCSD